MISTKAISAVQFTLAAIILILFSGCSPREEKADNLTSHRVTFTEGYTLPSDSISAPVQVTINESGPAKIKAGKPIITEADLNYRRIKVHEQNPLNKSSIKVMVPGSNRVPLPQTKPYIDSSVVAGTPIKVQAKDAYFRDQNSQNFSSYNKLQGLTHGNITTLLQDKIGQIWIGTYGGGVSRFDGKYFSHYSQKEGLSNNSILCMLEDKKGNIWFGTNGGGLNRYDGTRFSYFNEKNGLQHNMVNCLMEDKDGKIWIGSEKGLTCFDGKNFTCYSSLEGLSGNAVTSLLQDKKGNIWIGTARDGITVFDGQKFIQYNGENGPGNNQIACLIQDKKGIIWIGTKGSGLYSTDGNSFTNFAFGDENLKLIVSALMDDGQGNIWVGTYEAGIFEFDGKQYQQYTENEGLALNSVRSILQDNSGNIWIGTYGLGVSKLDSKRFTYPTTREGLSHKMICSIQENRDGKIWLCTGLGGISCFNGNSFYQYTEKEGLIQNTILCQLQDKKGRNWFGTLNNGVVCFDGETFTNYTKKDGLGSNELRCCMEDKAGNLWFGFSSGGVSCYNGKSFINYNQKNGLSGNDIRSMLQDQSGNYWFGTFNDGLTKFDGKKFTHFKDKEGIASNTVLSITQEKNGNIWFGTNGGGALLYDGKKMVQITEEEGLSNNVVQNIIEDKENNIWIGTRFGLNKIPASEKPKLKVTKNEYRKPLIHSYSYEDGFIGIGVNGGKSMIQTSDGKLWIGANDRLTIYHPGKDQPDTIPPHVQLTGLSLFNQNINWTAVNQNKDSLIQLSNGLNVKNYSFDSLSKWYNLPVNLNLAHNNNYLSFTFIGISMNRPKKIKYQYQLAGLEENWSTLSEHSEASFGNLAPGTYTFKVRAMNSQGIWSKTLDYPFTIHPPWWRTWWAYSFYLFSIVGGFSYYVRFREKALIKRQSELEQTVKERTIEVINEKKLVEAKNQEILDSIAYAKRIQSTILPSHRAFKANLNESFLIYLPKDIVAGDFYWFERVKGNNKVFFAACDCTGHGVPGAMVSVVCHHALNKALHEFKCKTPAEILDKTGEIVIRDFNKNMELTDEVKDGMDISLCAFDPDTGELEWAGANNPLLLCLKNEKLAEIKPDKQPIGSTDKRKPYTNHSFQLEKGDTFYLITDGFADQFGGPNNKKFQKSKLRDFINSISDSPLAEQQSTLLKRFEDWKGKNDQVDDVTIIGVRF